MKPSLNTKDKFFLGENQSINLHCISTGWLLHNRGFHLKVFLNRHSHCFCLRTAETPIWNDMVIVT